VRLCAQAGVEVLSIPGCCAAVNALAVSGLPTGRFTFEGFLSVNRKSRRERLCASLQFEQRTMLFHEAPHKLRTTLDDLAAAFGPDRPVALCRELTKLHEQTLRTTLGGGGGILPGEYEPQGESTCWWWPAPKPPKEPCRPDAGETGWSLVLAHAKGAGARKNSRTPCAGWPPTRGSSRNELYAAVLRALAGISPQTARREPSRS
jgi:16S rRNA (cytidine1402-2'-O)-methyltransferase